LFIVFIYGLAAASFAFGQSMHYLDCGAGNDAADALTPQTAWRSLEKASSFTFQPGDSLLLRRGARCEGMLWPKGSGKESEPIHLGAYGQGALPVIAGGGESAGLRLHNQQYWEIENLEVIGGSPYGIHIGGTEPELRHFRITNVVVHNVPGKPLTKDSGLVVIAPDDGAMTRIDDVIVDGVTAYRTSEWAGIIINGAGFDAGGHHDQGEHIEVRNSIVHDVAGDGILLARVANGVIEHNAAWYTGMQETESIGTPNSIWEWRCSDCRVEYNEGYFSDSPGVDGGVFDIDYGDTNNLLAHNFGHDSQGYCVSVFGAEGASGNSTQNTIRENTCIHNGRSPRLARRQGAIFLYTWNGGKLNGVDIEQNTVVWDPELEAAAFRSTAEFEGDLPNRFVNNTLASLSGAFVSSSTAFQFSGNRYCGPAKLSPRQSTIGSRLADSVSPGTLDALTSEESDPAAQKPEPACSCIQQIIAKAGSTDQNTASPIRREDSHGSETARLSQWPGSGKWILLAVLAPPGEPAAAASRSELVLIESMLNQFADLGLTTVVVPSRVISQDQLEQWQTDWNMNSAIQIDLADTRQLRKAYPSATGPQLLLVSASGQTAARWQYPVPPADVWLQIQSRLGVPRGTQQMPACSGPAMQSLTGAR
jgi:hypothetical protein